MTVFLVSQRAASILHADKIIVMDDGMVAGIGTHQQLLKHVRSIGKSVIPSFPKRRWSNMKKNKGTVGKVLKLIGPYKYLYCCHLYLR